MLIQRSFFTPKGLARQMLTKAGALEALKPLAERGILAFLSPYFPLMDYKVVKKISTIDTEIPEAIDESRLEIAMKYIKDSVSPEVIEKEGGPRNYAIRLLTHGKAGLINATLVSSNFFASEISTDWDFLWRGLNRILEKRRPRTLVPVAAQALGSMDLPFLSDVDFETILRVREKHADVFETWREGWRDACLGLEGITDPGEFNEELKRMRTDAIDPNLEKLDKWRGAVRPLGGIFKGLGAVPVTLGAFFGNLPLGLLGAAFIEPLALEYGKDLANYIVDKQMRRNFVYFLWKIKETS